MPRLIVMRHARSSRTSGGSSDHERQLDDRGRRDATRMARELIDCGWVPDVVVSSDATRTRETWELMAPEFDPEPPVEWSRSLYLAGVDEITDLFHALDDDVETMLVLGHNPGWEQAVGYLSGNEIGLTTANCALLSAQGAWPQLARPSHWELVTVLRPGDL